MSDVTHIGNKSDNSRAWTLEQALEQMLKDVKEGRIKATKALLLFVDESGGNYETGYRAVGTKASENISMCTIAIQDFYHMMTGRA